MISSSRQRQDGELKASLGYIVNEASSPLPIKIRKWERGARWRLWGMCGVIRERSGTQQDKTPRKTVMKKGRGVETSCLNFALVCARDKEINGIE